MVAFLSRDRVSGDERAWCDRVLTRSWSQHNAALRQLAEIVGLLNDHRIPSLALKGPLLARRHYSPPFLRKTSGDLDLAVLPEDMEGAISNLKVAGYQMAVSLKEAMAIGHHLVFRQAGRLPVEVHFRLSHGVLGLPVSEFFARAIPFPIPGGPVALVMDPVDELMHLVLHLVNDRFANLFHSWELKRMWQTVPRSCMGKFWKEWLRHILPVHSGFATLR